MAHAIRLPILLDLTLVAGLAMVVPAAHASATGQPALAAIFARHAIGTLVLAMLVALSVAGRAGTMRRGPAVLATLLAAYLLLPVVLALPFAAALPDTGLFNAWWEMLSSLTTTGATLYDPQKLSPTLHLWRGLVGWLGGLFTLTVAMALLAPLDVGGFEILSPDRRRRGVRTMAGAEPLPAARLRRWAVTTAPLYAGATLALWVTLMIAGATALDGLMQAMGTLSTSGIAARSGTIGATAGGRGAEMLVAVFLLAALSRRFWPGSANLAAQAPLIRDPELRMAAGLVLLVTVALLLRPILGVVGAATPVATPEAAAPGLLGGLVRALAAAWGAAFTGLSFLTTTGWVSMDWDGMRAWSGFSAPGLMLAGLAIMGGGIATTAGGVKLLRVYALARHSEREMQKIVHPASVAGGGPLERRLRQDGAYLAFIFFMLFAVTVAIVLALISLNPIAFETATMLSVAALTNTGPLAEAIPLMPTFAGSAGVAGAPWAGWAGLPVGTKSVLAFAMVAGRIEILSILALIAPGAWRR